MLFGAWVSAQELVKRMEKPMYSYIAMSNGDGSDDTESANKPANTGYITEDKPCPPLNKYRYE